MARSLEWYMHTLLALLVLVSPAYASVASEAESGINYLSTACDLPKRLMQVVWETLYTSGDGVQVSLRNAYWRVAEGRWGIWELAWGGALICAVQSVILWRMTAAAASLDAKSKAQEDPDDRPPSFWAAWRVNPEMGKSSDLLLLHQWNENC